MVELAKQLKALGVEDIAAVVGYRDELFLKETLEKYCKVYVATEDGSCGTKGNVIDAIKQEGLECKVIYSCGQCLRQSQHMPKKKTLRHRFHWKKEWRAELEHVLDALQRLRKKIPIPT